MKFYVCTSPIYAADKPWSVKGEQAGDVRTANGFTFLRVFNAGHVSCEPYDEIGRLLLYLCILFHCRWYRKISLKPPLLCSTLS